MLVIGEELKQALDDLSRREESTLFVTLLTALMTLLMRATGQGDVVVGSTVSGRIRVETEALFGLFLNTLALRTKLSGDITFRQAIALVRSSFLDGLEHHEVPFERVVQDLDPERTLTGHPLFEILFNFTPNPPRVMDLGDLRGSFKAPTPMRTQFSMTLFVLEWEGRLELRLHYRCELYPERRMALLHTVPSVADTWLRDRGPGVTLASLKRVFFAGEPLTACRRTRAPASSPWEPLFPRLSFWC